MSDHPGEREAATYFFAPSFFGFFLQVFFLQVKLFLFIEMSHRCLGELFIGRIVQEEGRLVGFLYRNTTNSDLTISMLSLERILLKST